MSSWLWWPWYPAAAASSSASIQPRKTNMVSICSYNVQQNQLECAKAKLRPVQTRVSPSEFPSRIPHIAEMAELHKKMREQSSVDNCHEPILVELRKQRKEITNE